MVAVNELLKLAIEAHGGARRWEQIERFRVAASITGAIWTLKGQPGLLDGVVLAGETHWNYFVAPFIFARADFTAQETEPWHEDGQAWRALLVTFLYKRYAHH